MNIISIFKAIREIISLIRLLLNMIDQFKEAQAVKKAEERKEGIEDAKKAVTEDEIFEAQKRIVRNKP